MAKHKHYDCIVAWAEGKPIQSKDAHSNYWNDVQTPSFHPNQEYRVKPEPNPDVLRTIVIDGYKIGGEQVYNLQPLWEGHLRNGIASGVIHITFDGVTGNLKSAEVINQD
jgi:hypothetical protein